MLEKETAVQYLKDEVAILKRQLEAERSKRDGSRMDIGSQLEVEVITQQLEALRAEHDRTALSHAQSMTFQKGAESQMAKLSREKDEMMQEYETIILDAKKEIRELEAQLQAEKAQVELLKAFKTTTRGKTPPTKQHPSIPTADQGESDWPKQPDIPPLKSQLADLQREGDSQAHDYSTQDTESPDPSTNVAPTDHLASTKPPASAGVQGETTTPSEQGSVFQHPDVEGEFSAPAVSLSSSGKQPSLQAIISEEDYQEKLIEMRKRIQDLQKSFANPQKLEEDLEKTLRAAMLTYESRIKTLTTENQEMKEIVQQLRSEITKPRTAEPALTQKLSQLETSLKASGHEKVELESRNSFLEKELEIAKQAADSSRDTAKELSSLVDSLQKRLEKQGDDKGKAELSTQFTKLEEAVQKERELVSEQVRGLEEKVTEERKLRLRAAEDFQQQEKAIRTELQEKHDKLIQELVSNYEKRIKGLTEALTACLNDTELIDELKKDNHESLSGAKLMNESEIQRVRENMKRLETQHTNSLSALQQSDHLELERMHTSIERLKREFAVLIEEEKVDFLDGHDHSEEPLETGHMKLLDHIQAQLAPDQSVLLSQAPEDPNSPRFKEHFKELVDAQIETVQKLYLAMFKVLKSRRDLSRHFMEEKEKAEYSVTDKSMEILKVKKTILDQGSQIQAFTSNVNQWELSHKLNVNLEQQIQEQQDMIEAFREKEAQFEEEANSRNSQQAEALMLVQIQKGRIAELEHKVSTLLKLVDSMGKGRGGFPSPLEDPQQLPTQQLRMTPALYRKRPVQPISAPSFPSPPQLTLATRRPPQPPHYQGYLYKSSPSKLLQQAQSVLNLKSAETAPLKRPGLSLEKLMSTIPLGKPTAAQDIARHRVLDRVWKQVEDVEPVDVIEKGKREEADRLMQRDKELLRQKVGAQLHQMGNEMLKRKVAAEIVTTKSDKMAKALSRMERIHEGAALKWEKRRKELVDERERQWLSVVTAVSDVVDYNNVYHPKFKMPLTSFVAPSDLTIRSYGVPNTASNLSGPNNRVTPLPNPPSGGRMSRTEHRKNFKPFQPFDTVTHLRTKMEGVIHSFEELRTLLKGSDDSSVPTSQQLLKFYGVKGQPVGLQPRRLKTSSPPTTFPPIDVTVNPPSR